MTGTVYPSYEGSSNVPHAQPYPHTWAQPPASPPPVSSRSYESRRRRRGGKQRIGIPLLIAGFVILGVGVLFIGVFYSSYVWTLEQEEGLVSGPSSGNADTLLHQSTNDLNLTYAGIDLVGVGVVALGMASGLNAMARFEQSEELGLPLR